MIVAPLSALAHHVYNRPPAAGWCAWSDGVDVRLYGAGMSVDWRLLGCQALHEIAEALVIHRHGVTRAEIDSHDFDTLDGPRVSRLAPYYRAHRFGVVIETIAALELGVPAEVHARVTAGIRTPAISPFALRQAP